MTDTTDTRDHIEQGRAALEAENARMREATSRLVIASGAMLTGVSVHNEREFYGPIEGAVVTELSNAAHYARAALQETTDG